MRIIPVMTLLGGCNSVGPVTPEPPTNAVLPVTLGAPAVAETAVTGQVDDPQFGDDPYDLAFQEWEATATCGVDEVDLVLAAPATGLYLGANEVHATFVLNGGVPESAIADLYQWADFNAYGSEFSRTVPAVDGSFDLAEAADLCGAAPAPFSGSFEIVTDAGSAVGTFVAETP